MNTRTRNRLIEQNLEGVRAIAARLARRLPPSFDRDDLVQQGCLGLIDAADRFDGRPGVTFFAFARRRVAGSMLDYIRRRHWRDATAVSLEEVRDFGRLPSQETNTHQVGDHSGLFRVTTPGRQISDTAHPTIEEQVARREEAAEVNRALARLPQRELFIVQRFYADGRTNQDIGPSLHIKGSRVGQLHKQALERLRGHLGGLRRVA
jgi:RNA polymerase sigma factor for flagellar operon FliA